MKLTKHRAKKPLVEAGIGAASVRHSDGEWSFTIDCHGPWTYGKGHEVSYTLHLSKLEMLQAMESWMACLARDEQAALKKSTSASSQNRGAQ